MNETIIDNWNSIVNPNDTVYHLGDFAWFGSTKIRKLLKGEIVLITGNHDKDAKRHKYLFQEVQRIKEVKHSLASHGIVLCHFAMRVWNRSHFNSWHLYGHSHGTTTGDNLGNWGKSMDVGVDTNNFYPYSIEDIAKIMATKPDNPNKLTSVRAN